jgi:outer membrane protein assembly factor BamB
LIGAAAVGGVVAVLFASGTVKLSGSEGSGGEEAAAEDGGDEAEDGRGRRGRRGRKRGRGRKGRKKGGKKGDDLRSLGYLAESRPEAHRDKKGLTVYDREKATPGYVLYNYCGWGAGLESDTENNHWGDIVLLDLEGKELHRWETPAVDERQGGVSIAKLLPGGDLIVNRADRNVARIDFEGNTVWSVDGVYHHDLAVEADESVWVMVERKLDLPETKRGRILDHGVAHISKDGKPLETLWFSDSLAQANQPRYAKILNKPRKRRGRGDVLHANAVEILQSDGPNGLWKKGDILSSIRNFNLVVILQRDTGKLLWEWGSGKLQHQHSPVMTADNKVLVFDNGYRRHSSKLVEIDPATNEVVWTYEGTPDNPFYSGTRGTVESLPSGNVFVGSSNDGRMFEANREGEIVWEYWTTEHSSKGKVVPIRAGHIHGALKESLDARLGTAAAAEPDADESAKAEPAKDEAEKAEPAKAAE